MNFGRRIGPRCACLCECNRRSVEGLKIHLALGLGDPWTWVDWPTCQECFDEAEASRKEALVA